MNEWMEFVINKNKTCLVEKQKLTWLENSQKKHENVMNIFSVWTESV